MKVEQTGNITSISGPVGIGTISPTKLLDVNGDAKIGNLNSRKYLKISSAQFPEIRYETPNSNEQIRLGVAHADVSTYGLEEGDFYVYTSTVNKMPFIVRRNSDLILNNNSGNVAIGKTQANYRLDVNGAIKGTTLHTNTQSWSDFVFYNNYKLRTLEEVEQHINEHGHLPEIPSEAEVTQKGINLGEMDAKLLQKIEELTLYMIEMNKRVNTLEEKNINLEKENQELKSQVSALRKEK